MKSNSITAIILTFNEEMHLQRCIDSLQSVCDTIIVVDSFSTDQTKAIALENKAQFIQNPWVNHASQFNWALEHATIATTWVLRMDADEYLTQELQEEITNKLPTIKSPINGIELPLKRVFLGRHIKRGTGLIKLLRIFRTGKGKSESRWMDEHIQLEEGETISFNNAFADDNLNSIHWWTTKHNGYAIREAIELLDLELDLLPKNTNQGKLIEQANKKRQLKLRYAKQPLFWRSFAYFVYRYFFKLGFLEGKEGFLWHFLQGWWYRTLVDAKIYEIKKACGNDVNKIKSHINKKHKLDL